MHTKNKANGGKFGFIVTGVRDPDVAGGPRSVARFTCHRCSSTLDVTLPAGKTLNPENIAKRAGFDGWDAHGYLKSHALCPACKRNRPVNDPEEKLKQMTMHIVSRTPAVLLNQRGHNRPSQQNPLLPA